MRPKAAIYYNSTSGYNRNKVSGSTVICSNENRWCNNRVAAQVSIVHRTCGYNRYRSIYCPGIGNHYRNSLVAASIGCIGSPSLLPVATQTCRSIGIDNQSNVPNTAISGSKGRSNHGVVATFVSAYSSGSYNRPGYVNGPGVSNAYRSSGIATNVSEVGSPSLRPKAAIYYNSTSGYNRNKVSGSTVICSNENRWCNNRVATQVGIVNSTSSNYWCSSIIGPSVGYHYRNSLITAGISSVGCPSLLPVATQTSRTIGSNNYRYCSNTTISSGKNRWNNGIVTTIVSAYSSGSYNRPGYVNGPGVSNAYRSSGIATNVSVAGSPSLRPKAAIRNYCTNGYHRNKVCV